MPLRTWAEPARLGRRARAGTWRASPVVAVGALLATLVATASAPPAAASTNPAARPGEDRPVAVRTGPIVWSAAKRIDTVGGLSSVSCPTARFCVAVDSQGHAFTWNGSSWTGPVLVDANPGRASENSDLNSVSCTDPRFCVAVDQGGAALRFDGSSWTKPVSLYRNDYLDWTAVSCATRAACLVVGDEDDSAFWNGHLWRPRLVASANNPFNLSAVSCPSAGLCVGLSGDDALYWNGRTWVRYQVIDTSSAGSFDSISCPMARFCMATGTGTYRWDGSSWTETSSTGGDAVSCPGTRLCVVVETGGTATVWDGSRWLAGARIDPAGAQYSNLAITVTCNRFGLCAAVSAAGDVELGKLG